MLSPSDFEYGSFAREINKVIKTQPEIGYCLMGLLCCLAGDLDGLRANFGKALRLSSDLTICANYAIALINAGCFSEGIKLSTNLEKPENGKLDQAIAINTECARFRTAAKLVQKWNELHPDQVREVPELFLAADIVEKAGITNDDLLPCLDVIGAFLREHQLIFLFEPMVAIAEYDGLKEITFRFGVSLDAKDTARLEAEMIDRLFESNVEMHESVIRFGLLAAGSMGQLAA